MGAHTTAAIGRTMSGRLDSFRVCGVSSIVPRAFATALLIALFSGALPARAGDEVFTDVWYYIAPAFKGSAQQAAQKLADLDTICINSVVTGCAPTYPGGPSQVCTIQMFDPPTGCAKTTSTVPTYNCEGLVFYPVNSSFAYCGHYLNTARPYHTEKTKGDPTNCPTCPGVGNPINFGTGNKFQREVDLPRTSSGLEFVRFYNSADNGTVTHMGANWRHSWMRAVRLMAQGVIYARREDGKALQFTLSGSQWVSDPDAAAWRLESIAPGWRLTTASDDVETYDASGALVSVTDRAGRTTTLAYSDGTASGPNGQTFDDIPDAIPLGQLLRVTDFQGRTLRFGYSASGRLSRMTDAAGLDYQYAYEATTQDLLTVTYPDARMRTYLYNEVAYTNGANMPNALTGITDENGARYATFTYQYVGSPIASNIKATSTSHAGGADRYQITYGTTGSATAVLDPLNTSRSVTFQVVQGLALNATKTQPCPGCGSPTATSTSTFDANGNVASVKDYNGNLACRTYDLARNLETARTEGLAGSGTCTARVTTPATRTISTEWHAQWRSPRRIAEPLRITSFSYHGEAGVSCAPAGASTDLLCSRTVQATTDANGSAAFGAAPDGAPRNWAYAYNAQGQVTLVDGPRTDVADTVANAYYATDDPGGNYSAGDLASMTNALGHTSSFTHYDGQGRLKRMVDANGLETLLDYWPRGWLKSRAVGSAATGFETTTYDYDFVGQLAKVTMPDASFIEYGYDDAHRLVSLRDGLANRIAYTLDAAGNRVAEQAFDVANTLSRAHTREFDALGRLYRDIDGTSPATQVTTQGFDANGNLASILDPLGRSTTQLFDARDRMTESRDPFNGAAFPTRYAYNGQDQLTQVVDPKGLATNYAVNGYGETSAQSSPDTGTTTFTFDPASNLKSTLDARGVLATYTYDALNRITLIAYPDEAVNYTFDTCANGIGRLCSVSDRTGTTAWTYDLRGRVTSKTHTVGAIAQTVSYAYNAAGQLVTVATPGGQVVEYGYANNRPVSVRVNGTTVLDQAFYEPFGPNGGWRWGNSTAAAPNFHMRLFDADFRIQSVESDRPLSGTAKVIGKTFAWDAASRITSIADLADAALSATYGHDALDRLTSANKGASAWGYTFDGVGNRLTSTANAASTTYAYQPGSHRLQSLSGARVLSYTFDAAGNMISDGTATWTYGGHNRPTQVQVGGTTTTYSINALGQRVRKATGASGTRFVYDESGRLVGEYTDAGALVAETIWLDDLPVAVVKAQPAAPAEQVIDNGAAGFSATGTWAASTSVAGYQGANYLTHAPGADAIGAVVVDNTDAGFGVTGTWNVSTSVAGYLGASYRTHAANGEPPSAIVVDNESAGASSTGTWLTSTSAGGYLGTNYQNHAGGTGANTFTWTATLPAAGSYQAYARWTASTNRATNATYTVATASGNQAVAVNQQVNGGAWQLLGTWAFNAGSATVTLSDQANGYVIADAVMFVPAGAQPSTATWQATLPSAGNWRVSARWPAHPNRATNATFRVQTPGGSIPVTVNQQANGGTWTILGTYTFNAGTTSISLNDQADGYVIADAVKFEPEGALPESATWSPTLSSSARFDVYAKWTALSNRSATANYVVTHQGGTTTITQNQQANGATWNLLGTWTFAPGQGVRLEASDGGYVIADALRFTPSADQPTTGGLFYVHPDHLGTPRAITRPADNALVWRWENAEPFGNSAPNENPSGLGTFQYNLRFPGQYFDVETSTHYNYFRDYDPGIGRYIKSDPIGLRGGLNTYAYGGGNPIRLSDPYGLDFSTRYGNWCGKNWSGGRQGPLIPQNPAGPIDSVDECCMAHDYCYARFECEPCGSNPEKKAGKTRCDSVLVNCLDALKGKAPQNWPKPPPPGKDTESYLFCQKAKWWFK